MEGMVQAQARPAAPPEPPIIASAQAALAGGSPGACLALLCALPPEQRQALPVHRLQALCHIQLAGQASASAAWWKVFGLASTAASAADIRRQYKRLAALVHPDKCGSPGAAEAFKSLRAAADCLLHTLQAEASAAGTGARSSKRARTEGGNEARGWGAGSGVEEEGWEEAEEEAEEWVPDGGGFPWWEQWDSGPSSKQSRQQAVAGEAAGPAAASRQAGEAGAAQREAQAQLEQLGLDELRAEVRRRQAAILAPPLDESGQRVPLQRLQAELRQARSLLSERTAAEAAAAASASGGGFLLS